MKIISSFLFVTIIILTSMAQSEDNPEKLIRAEAKETRQEVAINHSPDQRWQNFLSDKGWNSGVSEGGVSIIPDRELIISSAIVFTKVGIGQPGWIESRVAAFEQAEMEAKAKIIRFLMESVETQRSLSMLEHAVWEDGEVAKVQNLNEVAETLKRIGQKSMALTETTLDSALRKLNPDYDPARYEGKTVEELQIITEDIFKRQVKAIAMKTLIGVTPLYSTEEKSGKNEYQVLVGVIWSPKLNRLALSLFNAEYHIPVVTPSGKTLPQQIPSDELVLLGTMGTRIVIDEEGQYSVMAYGQSQPRRTSPNREQAALQEAKQVAANRARGQIVNFIREGMTLRESELSQELSREFSDMTVGTEIVRDYRKTIDGKNVKVKLSGLRVLKEWDCQHPTTGQQVAGAVVVWSPASADLGKQAGEMMQSRPKADSAAVQGKVQTPESLALPNMESMPVDTSSY